MALLPAVLTTPLRTVLDQATADFHRPQATSASRSNLDWQRVAAAFRHFFVRLFAGYGKFFVPKEGGRLTFDKNAFQQSHPKPIRKVT